MIALRVIGLLIWAVVGILVLTSKKVNKIQYALVWMTLLLLIIESILMMIIK